MNEKLIFTEFMQNRQDTLALDKLYETKDLNVRRQADIRMLRSKMENLRFDMQNYAMSNRIKFKNLQ